MKKLIGMLALSFATFACFSQDSIKMKDAGMQDTASMSSSTKMKDCLMMKDGQMMVVKGGQKMAMNRTMTLNNGTTVMQDGTVTMTSGDTKKLKDGQWIGMDGKIGKMKMDKKTNMNSDSSSMH